MICNAALVLVGALYLSFAYVATGYNLPYIPICPFYILTSRHCPLCGMTRSLGELLHGNIDSALACHPLAIPFLVFWVCFAVYYGFSLYICTAPKDLPTGVFTTLDDQQMPSVDDYLIDPEYPV